MKRSHPANRFMPMAVLILLAAALGLTSCSPAAAPATTGQTTNSQAVESTQGQAATQVPSTSEAPSTNSSAAVSLSADVMPILEKSCIKCHGGAQTEAGLSLASYDSIMKGGENGPAVVAGDPANSPLVDLVVQGKMPKRAAHLPQSEIDVLTAWVQAGAPNN